MRSSVLFGIAVFALSESIAWQGWRGFEHLSDAVPDIQAAERFVSTLELPDRGTINTRGGVNPPGTVWLYVPGVLAFSDHRLFELIGSAALQAGTCAGLYQLAGLVFGAPAARLAVVVYALSPAGLFFGSSLWPRGHPFFAVWFVFFVIRWAGERRPVYVGAALATLGLGMYVLPELAPLGLLIPIVWYRHRPPCRAATLCAAAAICGVVWFPYLRLEASRQFVDLVALVPAANITPPDYHRLWCDPELHSIEPEPEAAGGLLDRVVEKAAAAQLVLFGNFSQVALRPEASNDLTPLSRLRATALLVLTMLGLCWMVAPSGLRTSRRPGTPHAGYLLLASITLFGTLWAIHTPTDPISDVPIKVCIGGAAAFLLMAGVWTWPAAHIGQAGDAARSHARAIFALAVIVPWSVLLIIAESSRFAMYLWPLQAALIAYSGADVIPCLLPSLSRGRPVHIGLVAIVLASPSLAARVADWRALGWGGREAESVQPVARLAGHLSRTGRNQAHIGYLLTGYPRPGDAAYHAHDSRYKVGMEFDFMLARRFGIHNLDRCPEGVSSRDEYRIQTVGVAPEDLLLDVPAHVRDGAGFHRIGQFGSYVVLARSMNYSDSLSEARVDLLR